MTIDDQHKFIKFIQGWMYSGDVPITIFRYYFDEGEDESSNIYDKTAIELFQKGVITSLIQESSTAKCFTLSDEATEILKVYHEFKKL